MYPLLIYAIINSPVWHMNSGNPTATMWHNYAPNNPRADYMRVPLVSYGRSRAWQALKRSKKLAGVKEPEARWRVALSRNPSPFNLNCEGAMLELYVADENNVLHQKAAFPIYGKAYKRLSLEKQLAIELLWRTEIHTNGPE